MRRFLKAAFLSLAALLACGALALWVFIDREASAPELKPRIEAAASEFLGRPLTIGALEWRRWPNATLVGRDVRLFEDAEKRRALVESPVVEAHLALLSVFKLAAGITELRFVSPRMSLRRGANGEWNAERVVREIAARPKKPGRSWGTLAFNWFTIAGGTVTVEDEAGAFSALPPLDVQGSGKLRFGRRHLHFPFTLSGRLERSKTAVKVNGDLGPHSRLAVDVEGARASLASLAWPPAARWTGRWNAALHYNERPSPRWNLRLRAAPLSVSTAAPALDSLEFTGEYVPALRASFTGVARSSTTDIDAKGRLLGDELDLDVKSSKADVDALRAFAAAFASTGTPKDARAPRLKATISAARLVYGRAEARDLSAVVTRSTGPYVLERLSFESLGGSIAATGSYLPSGGDAALRMAWRASGLGVQELFRLAGSTHAAAGAADLDGALVTGLGPRFLPALSGKVRFDLKDGWFGGVPGLLKILARLNIATLFSEAQGRHRQRVPFKETRGEVAIVKGRIETGKPLVLENKTLQMAFMGTYDLPTRALDGKVVVNFLTVTDEVIRLIPGVRDILLGKEKGLIPIWLSVKGKASDPDVDVLPVKTITAPFWNATRRVLRLPKTLFEKLKF